MNTNQFLQDISTHRSSLMGLSIIAIQLFHQKFLGTFPFTIFHYYGYWGVDVFLLLSGMGLVNSLQKNTLKIYYQRRIMRILPSCAFFGILKTIVFLIISMACIVPDDTFQCNWGTPLCLDLWYIRAIIVYYLLSPVLYKYLQKCPYLTMTVVFLLFFANNLFLRVHDADSPTWIIERLPVFAIGMLLMVRKSLLSAKTITLSAISLLLAITIVSIYKGDIYTTYPWTAHMFSLALGTTAMIYFMVWILNHIPERLLVSIKWAGSISLEIYLIHEFVFNAAATLLPQYPPAILLIISIVLSWLIAYIGKMLIPDFRIQRKRDH